MTGSPTRVSYRPIANETSLVYLDWVIANRESLG